MATNVTKFTGRSNPTDGGEPPMSTLEMRVSHIEQAMATKDQLELAKAQLEMKILESKNELKEELVKARLELNGKIDSARLETGSLIGGARLETGSLRSELHSLLRQHIMWNVGSVIAVAGVVFAILRYTG